MVDAACRRRSFTLAARDLGVTHAAVSQAVDRLETELGARLFDRVGAGISPRPAAEILAAAYRDAAALVDGAWRKSRMSAETRLVLSAPSSLLTGWLGERLGVLAAALPGLKVVRAAREDQAELAGNDVALVFAAHAPAGLAATVLWEEHLVAVATPGLQRAVCRVGGPAWEALPLLIHDETAWRAWLTGEGAYAAAEALEGLRIGDAGMALEAALAGRGVALAATRNVDEALRTGRLAPCGVGQTVTGRRLMAVWPKSAEGDPALVQLVNWLKIEAGVREDVPAQLAELSAGRCAPA
jgi:DNA-binding transcriptional LysR family regulator